MSIRLYGVLILNLEQFSHLILVLHLLTLQLANVTVSSLMERIGTVSSLMERMMSRNKALKIKYFLPFNFAITKICVAIRLAEDITRMGSI